MLMTLQVCANCYKLLQVFATLFILFYLTRVDCLTGMPMQRLIRVGPWCPGEQ